jgi:hypothetical protein
LEQIGNNADVLIVNDDDIISTTDELTARDNLVLPPSNIGHLYCFSRAVLQRQSDSLIICVAPGPRNLTHAAFLLGGHLIVHEKVDVSSVKSAFRPISSSFSDSTQDCTLVMLDCWSALHRATELGWLDFSDEPSEDAIDMQEHLHYASALNGELHVVVPNKLLAFRAPADLPDGRAWMDDGGARRFGPSYYADILPDFDVSVVLRCGAAGAGAPYDASALEARGMGVEALAADARSGRLLAATDRVLTLARAAPGAIALHGAGGWEEGLLLSACLIRLHGFPARQAVAWARMAHPAAHPAPGFRVARYHTAAAVASAPGDGAPRPEH